MRLFQSKQKRQQADAKMSTAVVARRVERRMSIRDQPLLGDGTFKDDGHETDDTATLYDPNNSSDSLDYGFESPPVHAPRRKAVRPVSLPNYMMELAEVDNALCTTNGRQPKIAPRHGQQLYDDASCKGPELSDDIDYGYGTVDPDSLDYGKTTGSVVTRYGDCRQR